MNLPYFIMYLIHAVQCATQASGDTDGEAQASKESH